MTKPRVILGPSGAYWVRAETRSSLPLFATPWAADFLVATLAYFRGALGFRLYAYAVLPKALEAVIQPATSASVWGDFSPPGSRGSGATISKIMMEVKGSFAYWYNRRLDRRGSVWEKRFRDRVLLSAEDIRTCALEVHSRPTSLGLTERPEEYPYSGLVAGRNPVQVVDHLPVRRGGVPVSLTDMRRARKAG